MPKTSGRGSIHPPPTPLPQPPPPQALRFSQGNCERLVMNRKGPWEGYKRQAKQRLVRCLLPAFLCAHIFIEGETSGYEAAPPLYHGGGMNLRVRRRVKKLTKLNNLH